MNLGATRQSYEYDHADSSSLRTSVRTTDQCRHIAHGNPSQQRPL